jgi:hypothetical protein
MATLAEITAIWDILDLMYPGFSKGRTTKDMKAVLVIWCEMLAPFPVEVLKLAAKQHIATSKYPPAISEIRSIAISIMQPPRLTGMEAWGEVGREMRRVSGVYGTPQFSDPLIEKVVREMGWRNLCTSEMPAADRARFIEAYDQIQGRQQREQETLPEIRALSERMKLSAPRRNP